jgi:hypothetical protein
MFVSAGRLPPAEHVDLLPQHQVPCVIRLAAKADAMMAGASDYDADVIAKAITRRPWPTHEEVMAVYVSTGGPEPSCEPFRPSCVSGGLGRLWTIFALLLDFLLLEGDLVRRRRPHRRLQLCRPAFLFLRKAQVHSVDIASDRVDELTRTLCRVATATGLLRNVFVVHGQWAAAPRS